MEVVLDQKLVKHHMTWSYGIRIISLMGANNYCFLSVK